MDNDNIDGLDFPTPDPEDLPEIGETEDFGYVEEQEVDPNTVAFLDQEQAEWKGREAGFERAYGFSHHCRCSEDYAEGRTQTVTECFMRLCGEALDAAAASTYENRMLNVYLNEMLAINNDLAGMLHENGLGKELEDYFNTPVDIEDAEEVQDLDEPESDEPGDEEANDDDEGLALA